MRRPTPWIVALAAALASCAPRKVEPPKPDGPFGESGIPPQLRAKAPEGGTPVTPGGNASPAQPAAGSAAFTPEEEIVFTDPDNPDATLPELSTLLTAPKRRGPWEESETTAKQRAAREGKPLLIWFTDSARSPMCKALSQELFSTPAFEAWASEKLIRLRVDANPQLDDPNLSLDEKETRRADLRNYVTRLKKQYKVLGHPSLFLLNPSGEVIGRYRGYKRGQADFTWGLIKQGEAASASAYKEWRAGLEKKGYREWQDRKGRKILAKLTGYSNGTLTLIEPDGTRSRTHENKLSDADRAWIDQQKKLRGIR
jgi:thioredoxin-related protein